MQPETAKWLLFLWMLSIGVAVAVLGSYGLVRRRALILSRGWLVAASLFAVLPFLLRPFARELLNSDVMVDFWKSDLLIFHGVVAVLWLVLVIRMRWGLEPWYVLGLNGRHVVEILKSEMEAEIIPENEKRQDPLKKGALKLRFGDQLATVTPAYLKSCGLRLASGAMNPQLKKVIVNQPARSSVVFLVLSAFGSLLILACFT